MGTRSITAEATLAKRPSGAGSIESGPLSETMAAIQLSPERLRKSDFRRRGVASQCNRIISLDHTNKHEIKVFKSV